jgi:hypothetical protein
MTSGQAAAVCHRCGESKCATIGEEAVILEPAFDSWDDAWSCVPNLNGFFDSVWVVDRGNLTAAGRTPPRAWYSPMGFSNWSKGGA